ncbi:MAG: Stk1 family PASTA domain-containing Ser/Thr kinase [Lachnospiraceae bacterium]|nr:Stk1 family PASTA domain-containing Ser/Thr kinase [Lachnospiraceae bacterium]
MINIGTMIGNRYEVVEKAGAGGMADVYRAKDHRLNRSVAVKILKNEYSEDTKFIAKFRQEAQAVACLSHPNVVGVYDVGEEDGMHYIVMEFVDGITLKKYIDRKGKLSVREAVGIGLQIANGLEAAHSNHIIHRDIKPQNILISKDGTAKVTDFGIAKAASANTITANAMGSVHYISPEQARGGFSDEKSDIYSLGVTMYEMLSGTLPFSGESAVAVALAHIQEDATPLAAIDATIPHGLSNIVAKCMQKKTELRYPTSADLIADMKMFLQDPAGEYGIIKPLYENSETIFISSGDMDTLKAASGKIPTEETPAEENTEEDEDGNGDVDPKLEKALIIGSIVVALIIGVIIIFMLGKFIGLWDSGSVATVTPTPSASADVKASDSPEPSISDEQTTVPSIAGMTKDAAIVELENNDLQYKFTEQESDTVTEGQVIGTNPAEGSTVEKETKIEVYISSGPHKVGVPSVMSYTPEDAQSTLEAAGFTVKTGSKVYSDTVQKGLVAYSDPKGGAKVLPGATITLYISKGPEKTTVLVPDLIGMTKSQAKEALKARGLVLGKVTQANSENVTKNRVCVQSKKEGTEVEKGSSVDITLSLGPAATYSYYNNPLTIDNPFDYETDPAATIRIVLKQDGKTYPIREAQMTYSDFPLTLAQGDVQGHSASQGEVIVYKDGSQVDSYPITFRQVAD